MEHKVYVTLGFHINFYHSWRGDTPDEAGFGTDIRIVRKVLEMLNEANAKGMQARGYWDTEVYWTFENILPKYAPDIIEKLRQRVQSGQDEVLLGPYNNGANHAATEEEFRAAIALSLENERGSGLRQLFGRVAPFYRAQESMQTAGQNRIFLEEGVQGVLHYYAGVSFNTLSNFVPTMPLEQQYNPLWVRSMPDEPPIILWPTVSLSDILNHTSLEMWLLELHRLQTSGKVNSDLLLHINIDADADTWLPFRMPKALAWFPNTGGLPEYIRAINKYPWAQFTLPTEYIQNHPPQGEILVRQDLADGAFDGNYSWAEKLPSLRIWSTLERSRLHSYRADALARQTNPKLAQDIHNRLWEGTDSSFFQRMIGLSTTHFGMSTPVINEERQARAESILGTACRVATQAEREAAADICKHHTPDPDALYRFEVYNYARGRDREPIPATMAVRVPVILPEGVRQVSVRNGEDQEVQVSLVNTGELPDGRFSGEIIFIETLSGEERKSYRVNPAEGKTAASNPRTLSNQWLAIDFSEKSGFASFLHNRQEIGGKNFLQPFITYRSKRKPKVWNTTRFEFEEIEHEQWDGLCRVRLQTVIPMKTLEGSFKSLFSYTFTLFDDLPYLFVDVKADYAYTPPRHIIHNMQQKLRRLLDLDWIEVAPFQLAPCITSPAGKPLKVWKHNYLGITSSYELDYGHTNPKNKNVDSFNHQVTAGWVAMSNGKNGLLLAENAEALTSMAFCPMRLRETKGLQRLYLNPFGSYHGRQFDYSHINGNGLGSTMNTAISNAVKPNGPSFNGQTVRFSLMLAPYLGDEPSRAMQEHASAYFYPFGVNYLQTPDGVEAIVPGDIRLETEAIERAVKLASANPIPAPTAFLANPTDGAVTLVWDEPRDIPVTGYEVQWKDAEGAQWNSASIPACRRWTIPELENGKPYVFRIRAASGAKTSLWTETAGCIPGAVREAKLSSAVSAIPPWAFVKLAFHGIIHGIVTRLSRK